MAVRNDAPAPEKSRKANAAGPATPSPRSPFTQSLRSGFLFAFASPSSLSLPLVPVPLLLSCAAFFASRSFLSLSKKVVFSWDSHLFLEAPGLLLPVLTPQRARGGAETPPAPADLRNRRGWFASGELFSLYLVAGFRAWDRAWRPRSSNPSV